MISTGLWMERKSGKRCATESGYALGTAEFEQDSCAPYDTLERRSTFLSHCAQGVRRPFSERLACPPSRRNCIARRKSIAPLAAPPRRSTPVMHCSRRKPSSPFLAKAHSPLLSPPFLAPPSPFPLSPASPSLASAAPPLSVSARVALETARESLESRGAAARGEELTELILQQSSACLWSSMDYPTLYALSDKGLLL